MDRDPLKHFVAGVAPYVLALAQALEASKTSEDVTAKAVQFELSNKALVKIVQCCAAAYRDGVTLERVMDLR